MRPTLHSSGEIALSCTPARTDHAFWVAARSNNSKTGDVPTASVGETREASKDSCSGCPLLAGGDCYAQYGTPALGHGSMIRAVAHDGSADRYAAATAIDARHPDARMLRVTAIGDVARADWRQVYPAMRYATRSGLAIVGYTHFWGTPEGAHYAGVLMASVGSTHSVAVAVSQANQAVKDGWRPALVVPAGTTGTITLADGQTAILCPAIAAAAKGRAYTCNDCASGKRGALCDGANIGAPLPYFPDHGPRAARLPILAQGAR